MITCVHCVDLERLKIEEMILFILSSRNSQTVNILKHSSCKWRISAWYDFT